MQIQKKLSVMDLHKKYLEKEKLTMLTAYDFFFADLIDSCNVDITLVGDSLGTVFQGNTGTLSVSLDEIEYHLKIVSKANSHSFLVVDMPFLSYQLSVEQALTNAGRLLKSSSAQAVKLEGGLELTETIQRLTLLGIPVMGHIGLRPQNEHVMGGYKVQGRDHNSAQEILEQAKGLQSAGVFSIVLEGIPATLAKEITESLTIPTIGIGAGPDCSGQVLVINDLLGMQTSRSKHLPKFVRQYANLAESSKEAVTRFIDDVKAGNFPDKKESY